MGGRDLARCALPRLGLGTRAQHNGRELVVVLCPRLCVPLARVCCQRPSAGSHEQEQLVCIRSSLVRLGIRHSRSLLVFMRQLPLVHCNITRLLFVLARANRPRIDCRSILRARSQLLVELVLAELAGAVLLSLKKRCVSFWVRFTSIADFKRVETVIALDARLSETSCAPTVSPESHMLILPRHVRLAGSGSASRRHACQDPDVSLTHVLSQHARRELVNRTRRARQKSTRFPPQRRTAITPS